MGEREREGWGGERKREKSGDSHRGGKARASEAPYRVGPGVRLGQSEVAFGEGRGCGGKSKAWAER